jgi:hypothetical protein
MTCGFFGSEENSSKNKAKAKATAEAGNDKDEMRGSFTSFRMTTLLVDDDPF